MAEWKATGSGQFKHQAKGRFPLEAICGKILVDSRSTVGMKKCPVCSRIIGKRRGGSESPSQ